MLLTSSAVYDPGKLNTKTIFPPAAGGAAVAGGATAADGDGAGAAAGTAGGTTPTAPASAFGGAGAAAVSTGPSVVVSIGVVPALSSPLGCAAGVESARGRARGDGRTGGAAVTPAVGAAKAALTSGRTSSIILAYVRLWCVGLRGTALRSACWAWGSPRPQRTARQAAAAAAAAESSRAARQHKTKRTKREGVCKRWTVARARGMRLPDHCVSADSEQTRTPDRQKANRRARQTRAKKGTNRTQLVVWDDCAFEERSLCVARRTEGPPAILCALRPWLTFFHCRSVCPSSHSPSICVGLIFRRDV
jgi:hypothetical protein